LRKKRFSIRKCNDPLLYLERKAYLTAIHDALSGVEAARVTLVKVRYRITGKYGGRERPGSSIGPV
jgi:hypothetical protein